MKSIVDVKTVSGDCPVFCGEDAAGMLVEVWQPDWRQAAVIGDSNTLPLFGAPLAQVLRERCDSVLELSFDAGEAHKNRDSKRQLEDRLLQAGFDRHCCVVAVGGGIALDVAGYVAATYLRGVAHVNVATSLLAQVDAAIGGKTGVNTPYGKNLIGAFHQPHAVLIDTAALKSLADSELRNGLAEAVKHAVLADAELFGRIDAWSQRTTDLLLPQDLIARCVQIKAEVVMRDERESAYRQVLNFGHTVAHALETATSHRVAHGQAVAAGMVIEAGLAQRLCGFSREDGLRLVAVLDGLGLPSRPPIPFAQAREFFSHDKKTVAGQVRCALPQRIGEMYSNQERWAVPTPLEMIERAWTECYSGLR